MNHSEAMGNVAPPLQRARPPFRLRIRSFLTNDSAWEPHYNMLVAAVLAIWLTVFLIGLAAWAQHFFPADSGPHRTGTTTPESVEAASGATGDRL